jgi:hypothetical protein
MLTSWCGSQRHQRRDGSTPFSPGINDMVGEWGMVTAQIHLDHAFTGDVKVLHLKAPDRAVVGRFDDAVTMRNVVRPKTRPPQNRPKRKT